MKPENARAYESSGLRIDPPLGQVSNEGGESIRLGPVNMKVLAALLERPGQVVSRSELFDGVWGNQVVGEDALTRCISDIRAELRRLSGRADLIETLPKRGYRWIGEVRDPGAAAHVSAVKESRPLEADGSPGRTKGLPRRLARLTGRGLIYLAALIVMASAIVWSIDRFSFPGKPVVAILPITDVTAQPPLAARLDLELTQFLMGIDDIRVLARSAVDARPTNPYPYFRYEFDTRWVVEGELRKLSDGVMLTLAVVDARTGIVETQFTEPLDLAEPDNAVDPGGAFAALRRFFESQH